MSQDYQCHAESCLRQPMLDFSLRKHPTLSVSSVADARSKVIVSGVRLNELSRDK